MPEFYMAANFSFQCALYDSGLQPKNPSTCALLRTRVSSVSSSQDKVTVLSVGNYQSRLGKAAQNKKIKACQCRQVAALSLLAFLWERVFGKHRSDDAN
ncbi:hypothetical protein JN10_2227 [Altererythrobacter ishigakiensis]|uniref:Uncharacterized protein n=1 Tax=Altererythrobacter ishigakiensis TaxID=476157 RepID=A0A562UM35_9SPHN|nr:hypothetical protein JN10_2227 [Altererythrobacter ishigakiensis]